MSCFICASEKHAPLEKAWSFGKPSWVSLKSMHCRGRWTAQRCFVFKVVSSPLSDFSKKKMWVIVIDFQLIEKSHGVSVLHFPYLFHHFYFPINRLCFAFWTWRALSHLHSPSRWEHLRKDCTVCPLCVFNEIGEMWGFFPSSLGLDSSFSKPFFWPHKIRSPLCKKQPTVITA